MLAVTTRNKLRSWRFCLPMMQARRYVSQQLARTPGLIRYVSAIASPTEFLTLTVWEDRQTMFDFMSSDAHRKFMWMFSRWSASFWSMRWIPTTVEEGSWEDLSLSNLVRPEDQRLRPQTPQLQLPEQRPRRILGGRSIDPSMSGVCAITALVEGVSPLYLRVLPSVMQGLRQEADYPELLRWSVGTINPRRCLVLTMWREAPGEPAEAIRLLRQRLGASWTMYWTAGEYEIGHWDGLRLRQLASAQARQQRIKSEMIEHIVPDL
jgi:hypothetical protein